MSSPGSGSGDMSVLNWKCPGCFTQWPPPPGRTLPLTLKYCRVARCKRLFAALSSPSACQRQKQAVNRAQAVRPARSPCSQDEQQGSPATHPLPSPPEETGEMPSSWIPSPITDTSSFSALPALGCAGSEGTGVLRQSDPRWYPPAPAPHLVHPHLRCTAGPSSPT